MAENNDGLHTPISRGHWRPLPLGHLLENYNLFDKRVILVVGGWLVLFALSLLSVVYLVPTDWGSLATDQQAISIFLLYYPPLLICNFLLFWLGFEWGFIPAYLSTFMVALASQMPVQWAMLFGVAVVLSMAIFALVYYSTHFKYTLDSLSDLAFFVGVALVASMASSLGSLIWSHVQELTIEQTLVAWKSWWTGTFLQIVLINGPILYLVGDRVERLKDKYFDVPNRPEITLRWVYTSIIAVVVVLSIFILSAEKLGSLRIQEALLNSPEDIGTEIVGASQTFKLTAWISIIILVTVGLSGIRLVDTWNSTLKEQVRVKRALISEIHHRVKNNMQLIAGLIELQIHDSKSEEVGKELQKSHSRIYSMAKVHEQTYQQQDAADVNIEGFAPQVVQKIEANFIEGNNVNFKLNIPSVKLVISQAVNFGLLLNELLRYAAKISFNDERVISVDIEENDERITVHIHDAGGALPSVEDINTDKTLDLTLINRFCRQLNVQLDEDVAEGEGEILAFSFERRTPDPDQVIG
ncbi:Two-component sensor histidine kinase, contains HisKA and HATPase domains [Fodinibius salinus]|uniref:histidine kinase n=1 Tax=Fodinibius salinus TaxID=860790 RepID=A0A5D3YN22_9BACT|nr:histidine kinase dimerization/phosphoacceptor domain -containing protein [Fodinibius salinus]TYP94738.1 Two-component sensor histidine kinase, contains HisKA and HATPase domains [Fodinibius salinus]